GPVGGHGRHVRVDVRLPLLPDGPRPALRPPQRGPFSRLVLRDPGPGLRLVRGVHLRANGSSGPAGSGASLGNQMKAVIMAGGEGTRLRPLTSNQPKPMMPLANRPMMEHIVRLLKEHGFDEIVVTLAFLPQSIRT